MKKLSLLFAFLVGVMAALPAHATSTPSTSATSTPNTINASFGYYDFDKSHNPGSADYRLEYEWGMSLIPMMNHDWASFDRWAQLHPIVGFEGDSSGMSYFNAGLGLDAPIGQHLVFSWDEAAGLYGHGDEHQSLGSPFEIRSQLEAGWRFDNNMRASVYISHMSNVDTGNRNPGAETLGAYLRVPVSWLAH